MADTVKAGSKIEPGSKGPQFEKAAELLKKRYPSLKGKAQSANGEMGTLFKSIEDDLNVNKWAAKTAIALFVMDADRKDDRIRGLLGMLRVMGLMPEADLVDLAERRESGEDGDDTDIDVPLPLGDQQSDKPADDGDAKDFDADDGVASVEKGAKAAKDRAAKHLAGAA